MDVFEVMGTARAIRYLRADPVQPELVEKLIWAATRASSPGNSQQWGFVVVTDADKKARIGGAIADAFSGTFRDPGPDADRSVRLMLRGAKALAEGLATAPVLILVCGRMAYPRGNPDELMVWSACYPAAQNLIVAARGLGLGATFTTFQRRAEHVVRETLGIPDDVRMAALIPIGWPDRPHGPVNRRPVDEVIHWEAWQG
ncbi:MAG: nitroreductase [Acidimicrobiia bacterium]|nr:nitroreductase [Acidimicrobiia bacterium]